MMDIHEKKGIEIQQITVKTAKGVKSFWRGGQEFTQEPRTLAADDLTDEQMTQILLEDGRKLHVVVDEYEDVENDGIESQQADPSADNPAIGKKTYDNQLHFLNECEKADLLRCPNIGKATANKIIAARPLTDVKQVHELISNDDAAHQLNEYLDSIAAPLK